MFGKKYTLKFVKEDLEAIKAIMEMVGIKTKKYYTSKRWGCVYFRSNEEKMMKLLAKLDKYQIKDAFI